MKIEDLNILLDSKLNPIAASFKECKAITSSMLVVLEQFDNTISCINTSLDNIEHSFSESDVMFKNFERHCHDMHRHLDALSH